MRSAISDLHMEVARGPGGASGHPGGPVVAGRYRLVAPLGRGASGEVWEVEDLVLGGRAALKRLSLPGPEPARARREIATLRILRIPGVVRLLDEGDDEGHRFFVTELVQGAPFPGASDALAGELTMPAPTAMVSASSTTALSEELVRGSTALAFGEPRARSGRAAARWPTIAGVAEALLRTLDRVHAAGIVHRDLKPANVLVQRGGEPVVLDFGLCLPSAEGARLPAEGPIQGTPAYLSPEQIRGGPIDGRADLYAVGVMIYEALTGWLPHDATSIGMLLTLRASQRAVPVHDRDPSIPADVAALLDGILSVSPADRPRSAADVLERLSGSGAPSSAASWSLPEGDAPLDEHALAELFTGRDRLFHLRSDAAAALFRQTAGEPARVRSEVERWIKAGVARLDGGKLAIDRDTLDRWAAGFPIVPARAYQDADAGELPPDLAWRATAEACAPGDPARLVALVVAGQESLAAEEALSRARRLAEQGRLGLAAAALEEGLSSARGSTDTAAASAEKDLLTEWVKVAFAEHRPHALDRALHEVCRARTRADAPVARLEGLLRAAVAARTFLSTEAAAAAEALGEFDDPELERWRHWICVRTRAISSPVACQAALVRAEAWALRVDDATARAAVAGLRGLVHYMQGRFAEAARWHSAAASEERWVVLRVAQMFNEATALLEAFEPVRAREVAERAAAIAASCRHPSFEGRALATLRVAAYRAGDSMTPDLDLVEAQAEVDTPDILGLVCLTEAAIAFRIGDRAGAAALAGRAADAWHTSGQPYPEMLVRALAGAMVGGLSASEAESLAARAAKCPVPGIGIQTLAFLQMACPALPAPRPDVIAALCAQVPEEHWGERMDVLSVEEARSAVGRLVLCP